MDYSVGCCHPHPTGRVGFDVIRFVLQVFLVSNYMFVIVSLPDACGIVFLGMRYETADLYEPMIAPNEFRFGALGACVWL